MPILQTIRRTDIRLILIASGALMCIVALKPWAVLDEFQKTMGDGKIVAPICSAMGFSFALRITGCDREMVRLLLAPVRRASWLLLPAGCIVGFIANMAITSQTAAAAAVGPILIPLMIGAGYSPVIAAATLVLGCSGGGNLYNPGEPDVVNIALATKAPVDTVLQRMFLPELLGFTTAMLVLWITNLLVGGKQISSASANEEEKKPINWLKALLPPFPVILLLLTQPRLGLIRLPSQYAEGLPVPHAMIIGTVLVMIVNHKEFTAQTKAFFEGLGYAYTHVISLIISASCFIAGLNAIGVIEKLVKVVSNSDLVGKAIALCAPMALGIVSGSGTAPSVGFSKAVLPAIAQGDVGSAIGLGTLGAIGATFGRTMSPVAAVVIFSAALTSTEPLDVVKKTSLPLIIGAIIALLSMVW